MNEYELSSVDNIVERWFFNTKDEDNHHNKRSIKTSVAIIKSESNRDFINDKAMTIIAVNPEIILSEVASCMPVSLLGFYMQKKYINI